MSSIIEQIEKNQIKTLDKNIPSFKTGDSLKVHLIVSEGQRERIQIFQGIVIARTNSGMNSSFTVRKVSSGIGVERVFPLYALVVKRIEVIRCGKVRRAKLYYLRKRSGRSARITEDIRATVQAQSKEREITKNTRSTNEKNSQ